MAGKCYVRAYYDWIEQTAALSDAERGRLFIAVLEYARSGEAPELEGRESILFPVFRAVIDRDNKISAANSRNGAFGGRGNKATESEQKRNKATESEQKPTNNNNKNNNQNNNDNENNTPQQPPTGALADRFNRFWEAYPNKTGKQAAWKTWSKIRPSAEMTEVILNAVEYQKTWDKWTKDGGRYIPNPATWLNQGRWEDEKMPKNAGFTYDYGDDGGQSL